MLNTFNLCLLSLSQKLKAPSDPAVAKVPCIWKEIEISHIRNESYSDGLEIQKTKSYGNPQELE